VQIDSITVVVVRAGHAILAQISVRPYVNICVFHFALNWYSFPLDGNNVAGLQSYGTMIPLYGKVVPFINIKQ
jgi:hypothetical protein